MKQFNIFDVCIIGSGPSGVQAGLYLLRAQKSVVFFTSDKLGSLVSAHKIENFYGVGETSGEELYKKGIVEVERLGASIKWGIVSHIIPDFDSNTYVITDNKNTVKAKTVLLAMGKQIQKNLEYEINAKSGVSYCATCDGFFYKNKKIAIVGNSEYTLAEYKHLLNVTKDITIFTNGEKNSVFSKNCITNQNKIIKIENTKDLRVEIYLNDDSVYSFDGVFIAEGHFSINQLASTLGVQIKDDCVVVDDKMKTNINGVYACGDLIGGPYQIAKAVNDGMKAGLSILNYLKG